jgi:DNA polymerase
MIENTAAKEGIPTARRRLHLQRSEMPPAGNRTPQPDEMEICGQLLFRPGAIRPRAICALGSTARKPCSAQKGVTKLRGKWHSGDLPVIQIVRRSLLRLTIRDAKREA